VPYNLLVTGGAGFIGTNFVQYWHENHSDDRIVVLDALTYAGNKDNLEPYLGKNNFEFINGSICDRQLLDRTFKEYKIDRVINFAAESHVDRSIVGPDDFINTNILGTYELLRSAKNSWQSSGTEDHLFHHISTDEVYGSLGPGDPAFNESNTYAPNSPYSASKASSDHLVRSYHHTYGLKTTTSNCSNNYGAYQFPEKLIPLCLIKVLKGESLPIYGDGKQVRDWLHVDDHCRGIELVIKNGKYGETYNIGGNNEWRNIDLVNLICEAVDELFEKKSELNSLFPNAPSAQGHDAKSLITYVKDRPGHDTRYAVNANKIKSELGFSAAVAFERGIQSTIKWYIENQDWWLSILGRK